MKKIIIAETYYVISKNPIQSENYKKKQMKEDR